MLSFQDHASKPLAVVWSYPSVDLDFVISDWTLAALVELGNLLEHKISR